MNPILYAAGETAFTSNGLGRLADAITCTVTEERNGEYELYMEYPVTGRHFSDLQHSAIIFAVPADGKNPQPFRIYRIGKPINGICSIYAEHISYQLNFIPVMPFTLGTGTVATALQALVTNAAERCPFSVWTNKSTSGAYTVREPQPFRSLLGGVEGSILDVYGSGEYEFDRYQVKLWASRGSDNGVTIRYGKNLIDLTQDENIENTITGILPYWKNGETGDILTLPEKVLWSDNADNYPYKRTRPLDLSQNWGAQPTVEQLRAAGQAYIVNNNIGVPKVSLDVEFAPLWQLSGGAEDYHSLERVNLCDTVTVQFELLGVSAKAKVIRTVYNVLLDRYDRIEIGDARTSFTDVIRSSAEQAVEQAGGDQMSVLQAYVDHQTQLITGGLGGYVLLNPNANGEPQEILIMDTDDVSTAVNVIRMNKNGIGFSQNGYSGPYTSAWTIDGIFNTAFIGAGSITSVMLASDAVTAGNISLYGKMGVYTDSTLATNGGYIGYMAGATASGTTNGIAIMDSNSRNYVMATTAGVKMRNGSASTPGEVNISGGLMEFVGRGAYIQGDVYLNATSSGGTVSYSGTTRGRYFSAVNDSGVELVSITGTANGNIYVKNSSGTNLLYLGANGGNGYISLKDSSGTDLAALTAGDYGGAVRVKNSNGIQQAYIGIDSRGHGTMSINTVVLDVNNYGGRLNLKNIAGNDRAVMALSAYGGSLFLYNTTNEYSVSLAVDGTYGGVLTLWNNAGSYHTLTYALLDKLINL